MTTEHKIGAALLVLAVLMVACVPLTGPGMGLLALGAFLLGWHLLDPAEGRDDHV